ncbi:DUF669 domain-containing protein [Pectinatus haikarae]|uniref:DUF669 domain-containing protein n=1 Tax=Pectinatus haikarae TaxID=349096 RepID=A0ABT9Y3V1_9FIRM|nr:DUF669 domain-containing protein [Pectinatus haikarae]MDQ0202503.1 hypothetical protein [Pectinatus haikarae]
MDYSGLGTEMKNSNEVPFESDTAMGWDDEIEKENDFIVLPAGEYPFTVTSFERARFNGSEKMGPCNQAKLRLEIKTDKGTASIMHNLFLNRKCEGLLCAFFRGIGQKKHNEKLKMDWGKVIGATGRAKVGVRKYNDNDFNEIKSFIYPDEQPTQQNKFQAGRF